MADKVKGVAHVCSQECEHGHWRHHIKPLGGLTGSTRGKVNLDIIENYDDRDSAEGEDR